MTEILFLVYKTADIGSLCVYGVRVVIPLTGGNIDTTVLGRCIERGLAADGRLCRFVVTVSDRPGGIAELTKRIANIGVRYHTANSPSNYTTQDAQNVVSTV